MNRNALVWLLPLALLAAPALRADEMAASKVDGRAAFEAIKKLAGSWKEASGDGMVSETRFRITAAGHTVEEVMFPGTEHEMVNMYHLIGEELVLTHYCAGGNQPEMKLDTAASKPGDLVFVFTGGANIDPAKTGHIHGARLVIDGGRLREEWSSWNEGKDAGKMVFDMASSGS